MYTTIAQQDSLDVLSQDESSSASFDPLMNPPSNPSRGAAKGPVPASSMGTCNTKVVCFHFLSLTDMMIITSSSSNCVFFFYLTGDWYMIFLCPENFLKYYLFLSYINILLLRSTTTRFFPFLFVLKQQPWTHLLLLVIPVRLGLKV